MHFVVEGTKQYLLLIFLVPLWGALVLFSVLRQRGLVARWAQKHGFQVLHSEPRTYRTGPFSWASKGRSVFYVHVRDAAGQERRGWVQFGSMYTDLDGDHPEVQWEGGA